MIKTGGGEPRTQSELRQRRCDQSCLGEHALLDPAALLCDPRRKGTVLLLQGPSTGFDTWTSGEAPTVHVEGQAPDDWLDGLARRGHKVASSPAYDSGFGHAHAIVIDNDGFRAGAADPRTMVGTAAGI